MSQPRRLLTALRSALFGTRRTGAPAGTAPDHAASGHAVSGQPVSGQPVSGQPVSVQADPGRAGPDATVELDPATVRRPRWGYAPESDGALDPGEIVWTWVPYQERDGRGKDRPVVIVAVLTAESMLAVQLTSTDHSGDDDYLPLGIGPWDPARRPSWAGVARLFQVRQGGVRREGTFIDAGHYALIERTLRARYGWR